MSDRTGTSVVLIQDRDAPEYKGADTKKKKKTTRQNKIISEQRENDLKY